MGKVILADFESNDIEGLAIYLQELIEAELEAQVSQFELVEPLRSAVRYSIFPKGKRIRPLFSLLLALDLKKRIEPLISVVTALELVHTATLIHDDLPALDDDELRRGRATCHKAFSEGTALLAGDVLFELGIEIIVESALQEVTRLNLIECLLTAFREVCNGQQLDILDSEVNIMDLYERKTGALFQAAAEFVGHLYRLDSESFKAVSNLGKWLGIYFQVADDFLDSPEEEGTETTGPEDFNEQRSFVLNRISELKKEVSRSIGTPGGRLPGVDLILQRISSQMQEN